MDYEAKDWELNPHLYLQDKDGNFVRNKDGTPRKKAGRPKTDTEKAIKSARATISRNKEIFKSLNKSLTTLRVLLKNKKKHFKNLITLKKVLSLLMN